MNPILALIITNVIWGAASPIFKWSLQNIPPFTLAFIRFFFASLLLFPFAALRWQRLSWRDFLEIILIGILSVTINISFFFLGLQKTESINAPIIGSSAPVFLYFLSILFLKEKTKKRVLLGMLLSLLGVLVIIFYPILLDGKRLVVGEVQGNLYFLIATFSLMVFAPLISKNLLKRVSPIVVCAVSFLFGSMLFLPFAVKELEVWSFDQLNNQGLVGIVFGVFFSSFIAYFLYYYGISKIKVQEIGIFNYIDPVAAVVIAAPLLGEYPGPYFFLGSIMVFVGIFIAERRIHYHPIHKLPKNKHKLLLEKR